jgi:plastocyanin
MRPRPRAGNSRAAKEEIDVMSSAKRHPLPLAAAIGASLAVTIGAAIAVIPGIARSESSPPATASFTASDTGGGGYYSEEHHSWYVTGSTATQVTVAQGATVTFSYPTGKSRHNVDFSAGAAPSACTQTAGSSSGATPPLPHEPTTQGWSGSCTFNTAGTYVFMCDEHPTEMKGTIVVQAASQPPTNTGTGGSGTGTSTTPSPVSPGGQANTLSGSAIRLPSSQRGTSVHGSVLIAQSGSTLEVDALARAAGVARANHLAQVRVGRLVRSSLKAGRVSFAVVVDARARRALRRHRRLALQLRLTLTSPGGQALTRTLAVVLHRP